VNATAVLGLQSFDCQWVGNRFRIKPLPLVGYDNGHALSQLTAAMNLNQLVGVYPIAVNDCIAQSLPKRQFDRFTSGEIALISLGIQASISSEERLARLPAKPSRKSECPFVVCL
jgi:hypothetical protein